MPRTCHELVYKKLDTMTYLSFIAEPGEQLCEKIAGYTEALGIWGDYDPEFSEDYISWSDWNWWKDVFLSLWAPDKLYFKIIVHSLICLSGFILGLLYRYGTIRALRSDVSIHKNKAALSMQQLWSALEEKLSIKTEIEKLKIDKDQSKRDLRLIEGENENLKAKAWGLERNVTILQSDRGALEGKIRDLLNASKLTQDSFVGGGGLRDETISTQEELRACKQKMIALQGLVKNLIEHTKQKDAAMVGAMQNGSQV